MDKSWHHRTLVFVFLTGLAFANGGFCLDFDLTGHQNLTGPGAANLMLTISPYNESLINRSLRIEISGAMAGTLVLPEVERKTDLGYFQLAAGNYSFNYYVVERMEESLEHSGDLIAHGSSEFTIHAQPEPANEEEKLLDPVNLGFMAVALFVLALILIIHQTSEYQEGEEDQG